MCELVEMFKTAVLFAGTNDNPMSAAFPLVCALRNEIYELLESDRFASRLVTTRVLHKRAFWMFVST